MIGAGEVIRRYLSKDTSKGLGPWLDAAELDAWSSFRQAGTPTRPHEIFLVTGETLTSEFATGYITNNNGARCRLPRCRIAYRDNVENQSARSVRIDDDKLFDEPIHFDSVCDDINLVSGRAQELYPIIFEVKRSKPMAVIPNVLKKEFKTFMKDFKLRVSDFQLIY